MQADRILDDYDGWIERQALAARTRSSYRRWVRELIAYLTAGGELDAFLVVDGEDDRRALLAGGSLMTSSGPDEASRPRLQPTTTLRPCGARRPS